MSDKEEKMAWEFKDRSGESWKYPNPSSGPRFRLPPSSPTFLYTQELDGTWVPIPVQSVQFQITFPLTRPTPPRTIQCRPDQPVIGYRVWRPAYGDRNGMRPTLNSISVESHWIPGLNVASCVQGDPFILGGGWTPAHRAPHPECECGFWACASPQELHDSIEWARYEPKVYGLVQLWGSVLEHKMGMRAQKAQILALQHENHSIVTMLGQEYDVPVAKDLEQYAADWLRSYAG